MLTRIKSLTDAVFCHSDMCTANQSIIEIYSELSITKLKVIKLILRFDPNTIYLLKSDSAT
jgi:hypothetical protein